MIQPDKILLVDVPEAALVAHTSSRRHDPETKQIYFLDGTKPPPEDVPVERLIQLDNDHEDKVRELVAPYFKTKAAIMAQNGKKCCVVDGEGTFPSDSGNPAGKTADEVWKGVCSSLYGAVMKAEKRKK